MAPLEPELGVAIVIEAHPFPAPFTVTVLALVAVASPVGIVDAVAADTLLRQVAVPLSGVAGGARDPSMALPEREAGIGVIEAALLPAPGAMALFALPAQFATVRVIIAVACVALVRCLAELVSGPVAGEALQFPVRPFESEVGPGVVEGGLVQEQDVRPATLVVGMAMAAFGLPDVADPAVESHRLADVAVHLVVTVAAQPALLHLAEGLVTALALVLVAGMALDQGAGHEQALEAPIGGVAGEAHHAEEGEQQQAWREQDGPSPAEGAPPPALTNAVKREAERASHRSCRPRASMPISSHQYM